MPQNCPVACKRSVLVVRKLTLDHICGKAQAVLFKSLKCGFENVQKFSCEIKCTNVHSSRARSSSAQILHCHHYGIATDEKNTLPSHTKVGTKCATFKIQCIDGKTILILKYNMVQKLDRVKRRYNHPIYKAFLR